MEMVFLLIISRGFILFNLILALMKMELLVIYIALVFL